MHTHTHIHTHIHTRTRAYTLPPVFLQRQIILFAAAKEQAYEIVPKGLLIFLGSLYKESAKTTPETLVYRFERQTARKFCSSFQKHCVLNLERRILSQEPSDIFILYCNVLFHGK